MYSGPNLDKCNTEIRKYINEKKELQNHVLKIIEQSEIDDDTGYHNLILFLAKYKEEKEELIHFLHLILVIANNHHRSPNFL